MIIAKHKLPLIPNPCYCRLSLDQFLQMPNLAGVVRCKKKAERCLGFCKVFWYFLHQQGSLMIIVVYWDAQFIGLYGHKPAWVHQNCLELRGRQGNIPHAWQFRENELCWWQLWFSALWDLCRLQQGTVLPLPPHRLCFLFPSASNSICLCGRDFSEDWSPLTKGSFSPAWNLKKELSCCLLCPVS